MARGAGFVARARRAVGHALHRRCPRCGKGTLFAGWNRLADTCDACGVRYLHDQGEPWVFLLLLDRALFIFPPIALIYFGWLPARTTLRVLEFALLAVVLMITTPHRTAVAVALAYVTRPGGDDGADPLS